MFPQPVQSVQSIFYSLILFGRPTVVHRKFVQPRPNAILRYLDFLLYFRPVGFEQCGRVEFLGCGRSHGYQDQVWLAQRLL